jgi:hypothetical protein
MGVRTGSTSEIDVCPAQAHHLAASKAPVSAEEALNLGPPLGLLQLLQDLGRFGGTRGDWSGLGEGDEVVEITAKTRKDERLRQLEKPLPTEFKSLLRVDLSSVATSTKVVGRSAGGSDQARAGAQVLRLPR